MRVGGFSMRGLRDGAGCAGEVMEGLRWWEMRMGMT